MAKKNQKKTIVCTHLEKVVGTVGTCIHCGQMRDYGRAKPPPFILKRGRIKGVLTEIHPPEKITEMMTRSYMKRSLVPTTKVGLGSPEN